MKIEIEKFGDNHKVTVEFSARVWGHAPSINDATGNALAALFDQLRPANDLRRTAAVAERRIEPLLADLVSAVRALEQVGVNVSARVDHDDGAWEALVALGGAVEAKTSTDMGYERVAIEVKTTGYVPSEVYASRRRHEPDEADNPDVPL